MTNSLQPGETGQPLPDGEAVLRLFKPSKDGQVLEVHFAITGQDDVAPLYSLSVWAESLTSPLQARDFMGVNKFAYQLYSRLSVTRIRTLTTPDLVEPVLNVVWDTLYEDEETGQRNTEPGAEGHAGLTGLRRPPGMEKQIYKTLRVRLADMANESLNSYT